MNTNNTRLNREQPIHLTMTLDTQPEARIGTRPRGHKRAAWEASKGRDTGRHTYPGNSERCSKICCSMFSLRFLWGALLGWSCWSLLARPIDPLFQHAYAFFWKIPLSACRPGPRRRSTRPPRCSGWRCVQMCTAISYKDLAGRPSSYHLLRGNPTPLTMHLCLEFLDFVPSIRKGKTFQMRQSCRG